MRARVKIHARKAKRGGESQYHVSPFSRGEIFTRARVFAPSTIPQEKLELLVV